jgi:hypothetical protein
VAGAGYVALTLLALVLTAGCGMAVLGFATLFGYEILGGC